MYTFANFRYNLGLSKGKFDYGYKTKLYDYILEQEEEEEDEEEEHEGRGRTAHLSLDSLLRSTYRCIVLTAAIAFADRGPKVELI